MDGFTGEIRPMAFSFAPYGWMQCAGQLLPISQYAALFSLLGTYYGGNGQTNFALPNMQSNVAIGAGQLNGGGTVYDVGEVGGAQNVTIISTEMPAHNHTLNGGTVTTPATSDINTPASNSMITNPYAKANPQATTGVPGRGFGPVSGTPIAQLNIQTIGSAGGSLPHSNMMPYLAITYCICMQGDFPARN